MAQDPKQSLESMVYTYRLIVRQIMVESRSTSALGLFDY